MQSDELIVDGIKFKLRTNSALAPSQKYEAVIRYLVNTHVKVKLSEEIEIAEMYSYTSIPKLQMFATKKASP